MTRTSAKFHFRDVCVVIGFVSLCVCVCVCGVIVFSRCVFICMCFVCVGADMKDTVLVLSATCKKNKEMVIADKMIMSRCRQTLHDAGHKCRI